MENTTARYFYCYSLKLYYFLRAFSEECVTSKINSRSGNRYWVFNKSNRLDKLIQTYNSMKHIYN